jgi:hypothetical protein
MPKSDQQLLVITDQEKGDAIVRIVRELREWRKRNPDAPRGHGERDPRLDVD